MPLAQCNRFFGSDLPAQCESVVQMSEFKFLDSKNLGSRFSTLNVVVAGAAVLFASLMLIFIQFLALRADLLGDLRIQAQIVGDNGASALLFHDPVAARKTLEPLAALPHLREAELLSATGDAVLASYRKLPDTRIDSPWPDEGARFHPHAVDVVHRIEFDGQEVGRVRLRASLEPLYHRLLRYASTTFLVSACALGLAILVVSRMRRAVDRAESRLQYLAHTDPVTGLPNRHAFNERLEFALARVNRFSGSVALLLIDLDNFKLVNDSLGHQSGDLLLAAVAKQFTETLRHGDIVCRIGGDEFAVIVENPAQAIEAAQIGEKLVHAIASPILIGRQEIFVSASIGISFSPGDAADAEELVRTADTALYAAKARGKGMVALFSPEMNAKAQHRLSLESSLRHAIERREFVLHYQPQVELATGRIVGVEALLRWQQPGRLVLPNEFIPVAEESGLIVPIGEWVLQEACAQARRWCDKGLPAVTMAINLSARQFDNPDLPQIVQAAAAAAGLDSDKVELEITESALMRNTTNSAGMLLQLSAAGFRLAVDDFGTGYSSMSYLKRFPIHRLKIDRSFITDLTVDRDDKAIVAAIIAMAQALELDVIAEGVETPEQYAKLQKLGCDLAQGYLLSRPLTAEALEPLLVARAASGV